MSPLLVAASYDNLVLGSHLTHVILKFVKTAGAVNYPSNAPHLETLVALNTRKTAFLHFEQIIGKGDTPIFDIYILPSDQKNFLLEKSENYFLKDQKLPLNKSLYAGALGFYGLENSSESEPDNIKTHGMHLTVEVSQLLQQLQSWLMFYNEGIRLMLRPRENMPPDASVSIGKITLYIE